MNTGNLWDIFCKVIDNYGDIGVSWRLATGLAQRGERVRLWVDDPSPLNWMAPEGHPRVELKHWTAAMPMADIKPGSIVLEAFGCEIDPEFIRVYADRLEDSGETACWINLEYLSAEKFAERSHGLPSPVMSGPGAGLTKHFFYPGFTSATGGLLREPDLLTRQAQFDRLAWLASTGVTFQGEQLVSLFCYEPPALSQLLDRLASTAQPTRLLITPGRASAAMRACLAHKNTEQPGWNENKALSFSYLPALSQRDFDHLLWSCDLNFVRGEDSLVRALWANKPFVWQIYPQDDDAHHLKLDAFLAVLNAPPSLRAFHRAWNGIALECNTAFPTLDLDAWQQTVTQARYWQLLQVDLVSQLIGFSQKNH